MIRKARLGNKGSNPGNSVLSNLTAELLGALRRDNEEKAFQVIERAISSGLDGPSIYLNVLQPTLDQVGGLWECGQVSIGEEHRASATVEWLMKSLWYEFQPQVTRSRHRSLLVSAVRNERHDIGLTMVCDFLRLDGWQVVNLGADTPECEIARMAALIHPSLCLLSVSRVDTFDALSETVAELRLRDRDLPILVGGRIFRVDPTIVCPEGVAVVAKDANEAVTEVRKLLAPL